MTELLYLATVEEAYVTTFRAQVVALPPGGVVLDRTRFYPTGGGQPCDLGALRLADGGSVPVTDVAKSGDAVVHRLGRRGPAGSGLALAAEVEGTIDWPRRHRHMRGHTFQHLLSARVFALTGRRTRKANLSGKGGVIDVEGPWPADLPERALDADVRAYVDADRPVRIRQLARADYEREDGGRSGLVPLPPHVDPVRVVEIEAADRCPCGGTHLRRTGEIGGFGILPPAPMVGGDVRLAFTLDERAPPTPLG
ncbi:MAG: alanyl-tRNA editing protein [Thermoplasmata archaeon]|nr:alanyl-tRNA editing protein [Thermoplasmata archaeon]